MQYSILSVVSLLILFSQPGYSLHDTTRVQRDSLAGKEIRFMPNFPGQKIKSIGTYVATVEDSATFRLLYGLSVLNTVRGNVPNTGISPNAPFATVRQNALLMIDGLSYVQSSANLYNMNAFDYDQLSVLSRNASVWYGIDAAGGAFVIRSRSGEGFLKPTFELNSSLISAPAKLGASSLSQSYFSNAVAYMQDFGKIDTRISYNYRPMFSRNDKYHNIKINTGFNLNSKFSARLIIDKVYNKSSSSFRSSSPIITDTIYNEMDSSYYYVSDSIIFSSSEARNDRAFTQGNLMLRYQPVRWLTFSSQGSLGRFSESNESLNNGNEFQSDSEQNRSLVNIFATIRPNLGHSFSLSTVLGMQYLSSEHEQVSNYGYYSTSYRDKYYLSSLHFGFRDFLFTNYTLRKDFESSIPDANEKPTHSFTAAFLFSEAFGWKNNFFSSGRIRAGTGHAFTEQAFSSTTIRRPEALFEIGTDLSFFKNRAGLTINYFERKRKDWKAVLIATTAYQDYFNVPESNDNGLEIILEATPIKRNDFNYRTTLLWWKSQGDFFPEGDGPVINGANSSLLNTITFRNFLLSCLLVMQEGDLLLYQQVNKHRQVKLRDLSFGYEFSKAVSRIGFKKAHVSLSLRNNWLLYSSSGKDIDTYFTKAPIQSSSLNLYLML